MQKAIQLAGGREALAELLGVGKQATYAWSWEDDELPEARVWQLRILRPEWFSDDPAAKERRRMARERAAAARRIKQLMAEIGKEVQRWQAG